MVLFYNNTGYGGAVTCALSSTFIVYGNSNGFMITKQHLVAVYI